MHSFKFPCGEKFCLIIACRKSNDPSTEACSSSITDPFESGNNKRIKIFWFKVGGPSIYSLQYCNSSDHVPHRASVNCRSANRCL